MLFRNAPEPYTTNVPAVVVAALVLGGLWAFAVSRAVQVRHRPVAVGAHMMLGEVGEIRGPRQVFVNGELWRARPANGAALERGQRVRVERVDDDGLVLHVRPVEAPGPGPA